MGSTLPCRSAVAIFNYATVQGCSPPTLHPSPGLCTPLGHSPHGMVAGVAPPRPMGGCPRPFPPVGSRPPSPRHHPGNRRRGTALPWPRPTAQAHTEPRCLSGLLGRGQAGGTYRRRRHAGLCETAGRAHAVPGYGMTARTRHTLPGTGRRADGWAGAPQPPALPALPPHRGIPLPVRGVAPVAGTMLGGCTPLPRATSYVGRAAGGPPGWGGSGGTGGHQWLARGGTRQAWGGGHPPDTQCCPTGTPTSPPAGPPTTRTRTGTRLGGGGVPHTRHALRPALRLNAHGCAHAHTRVPWRAGSMAGVNGHTQAHMGIACLSRESSLGVLAQQEPPRDTHGIPGRRTRVHTHAHTHTRTGRVQTGRPAAHGDTRDTHTHACTPLRSPHHAPPATLPAPASLERGGSGRGAAWPRPAGGLAGEGAAALQGEEEEEEEGEAKSSTRLTVLPAEPWKRQHGGRAGGLAPRVRPANVGVPRGSRRSPPASCRRREGLSMGDGGLEPTGLASVLGTGVPRPVTPGVPAPSLPCPLTPGVGAVSMEGLCVRRAGQLSGQGEASRRGGRRLHQQHHVWRRRRLIAGVRGVWQLQRHRIAGNLREEGQPASLPRQGQPGMGQGARCATHPAPGCTGWHGRGAAPSLGGSGLTPTLTGAGGWGDGAQEGSAPSLEAQERPLPAVGLEDGELGYPKPGEAQECPQPTVGLEDRAMGHGRGTAPNLVVWGAGWAHLRERLNGGDGEDGLQGTWGAGGLVGGRDRAVGGRHQRGLTLQQLHDGADVRSHAGLQPADRYALGCAQGTACCPC